MNKLFPLQHNCGMAIELIVRANARNARSAIRDLRKAIDLLGEQIEYLRIVLDESVKTEIEQDDPEEVLYRICFECGNEFWTTNIRKIYCSRKCNAAVQQRKFRIQK